MDNNLLGSKELYEVSLKATYPIEINGVKFEKGELLLMDIDGNIVDTFSHHDNNSYTYPVMGKYDGRELSTISQEFNVRRGDFLYAIGYNGTEKKVFVYKMKLTNIFPN